MIPGMGQMAKQVDAQEATQKLKRVEAIIYSMTLFERQNPDILNGSRRRRIAKGSGSTVQDVNQLLKQFRDMRKMMKQMGLMGKGKKGKRRNGRGLPGGHIMDMFNGMR